MELHAVQPPLETVPYPVEACEDTTVVATPVKQNLDDPGLYFNRELSWLKFNERVLQQAATSRNPILERVKFLAIYGSNMDEFAMKRIGGLKQQVAAGIQDATVDGRTPQQQMDECFQVLNAIQPHREEVTREVFAELKKKGIEFLDYSQLSTEEQQRIRNHFYDNIFPLVTPQSVDPAHPFPFISNLSLNLFVTPALSR